MGYIVRRNTNQVNVYSLLGVTYLSNTSIALLGTMKSSKTIYDKIHFKHFAWKTFCSIEIQILWPRSKLTRACIRINSSKDPCQY